MSSNLRVARQALISPYISVVFRHTSDIYIKKKVWKRILIYKLAPVVTNTFSQSFGRFVVIGVSLYLYFAMYMKPFSFRDKGC